MITSLTARKNEAWNMSWSSCGTISQTISTERRYKRPTFTQSKEFIQHLKFQKVLDRYDDLYSMDMFGESTDGHKYGTIYQAVKRIKHRLKRRYGPVTESIADQPF